MFWEGYWVLVRPKAGTSLCLSWRCSRSLEAHVLPQCLCALGPTRPVTLFTFVVLLSCIVFSFFGLCLKKLQPRKPSSYQVSTVIRLSGSLTSLHSLLTFLGSVCHGKSEAVPGCPPASAGDP